MHFIVLSYPYIEKPALFCQRYYGVDLPPAAGQATDSSNTSSTRIYFPAHSTMLVFPPQATSTAPILRCSQYKSAGTSHTSKEHTSNSQPATASERIQPYLLLRLSFEKWGCSNEVQTSACNGNNRTAIEHD